MKWLLTLMLGAVVWHYAVSPELARMKENQAVQAQQSETQRAGDMLLATRPWDRADAVMAELLIKELGSHSASAESSSILRVLKCRKQELDALDAGIAVRQKVIDKLMARSKGLE